MRSPAVAGLLLVTLAAVSPARSVESQGVGGLIKKKAAEAVKGKDANKEPPKDDKKDEGLQSQLGECGPLTPEKVSDFVRGLKTEQNYLDDFDKMLRGLKTHEQIIACRQQEAMSGTIQKIMSQGITVNATPAQLEKAMAKNAVDVEKHMVQKCGEDPSKFDKRKAAEDARRAGIKASGLSETCYEALKEPTLQFCKLSAAERQTAVDQGIKVPVRARAWVYTKAEANAIAGHCVDILAALKAIGYIE